MKNNYLILTCIIIVSFVFRFLLLSSVPLGFTWDEAALGYNAYSLLSTGKDEYGQLFPLVFKSFGDYKPGLYIYFSVLPVFLFGLNIFSTRFASAIAGTILVILIYILTKSLFPKNKTAALASAFLMATSPWAIHFSRGAWEANLNLMLIVLGTVLFMRKRYVLSVIFFGLTFFAYQGAKLFTPLFIIGMLIFYQHRLSFYKRFLFLITVGLFALPLLWGFSTQSGRLKVFSVFSYTRSVDTVSTLKDHDLVTHTQSLFPLFHSESLDQVRGIIQRFVNHLSPEFLFISGDWSNPRHSISYHGYFYYPTLILLAFGFYRLAVKFTPSGSLLFLWIVCAVLPSALSRDIVSAVRSLPLVVPLCVISGLGFAYLSRFKFVAVGMISAFMAFIFYFSDMYFIHTPKLNGVSWLTPYAATVQLIKRELPYYEQVYFSDKLGQPYIFYLFFTAYHPAAYQAQASLVENPFGDVGKVTQIDNIYFQPLYWPAQRATPGKSLFIGDIYELPESDIHLDNLTDYGIISYPDGSPGFRVVGLNKYE